MIRRKNWEKKDCRKNLTDQRRRGRVNLMRGLKFYDKKRLKLVIKKGNADTFYEPINSLNALIIQ